MPSSQHWLVCMSSTERQYLGLSLFLIVFHYKSPCKSDDKSQQKPDKKFAESLRRNLHNQLNLCRSIVDFCLESRDTRLHKESICLLSEPPFHNSPIMIHNISLTELPKEILVVCDDNKLKVSVVPSFVDDTASVD